MAKIKMGALAQDARGSLAGTTFTKNRYGAVARQKVSPVQPRSARQLQQRSIFSAQSQGWRALTDAQRAQWVTWAASHPIVDVFGDSQTLSGNAAYVRVNSTLQTLGLAAVSVPPADPTTPPQACTGVAAVASTQTTTITWAAAPDADDEYEIWVTRGFSPGATPTKSQFRLAFAGKPGTGTTKDIVSGGIANNVAYAVGQKVAVIIVRCSQDGVIIDTSRFDCIAS